MFPIILIWLALVKGPALEATALTVEDGLYSKLTVQVTEAVPRQLCHRALNNLQVRQLNFNRQSYFLSKSIIKTDIYVLDLCMFLINKYVRQITEQQDSPFLSFILCLRYQAEKLVSEK